MSPVQGFTVDPCSVIARVPRAAHAESKRQRPAVSTAKGIDG